MKNAFLDGKIEEEVYTKAPLGFSSDFTLGEGFNGLKQSPRAWFGRFIATMTKFGYK